MSFLGSAGATCPVCRSLAQVARLPLGPLLHSPPRLPELLSQPSELLELVLFLFPDVAITRYHDCRLPLSSTNCYVWLVGLSLVGFWASVVGTVQGLCIHDGSSSSFSCFCCLHKKLCLSLITACLANVKMYFVVWVSELEYECRLVYS